MSDKIKKLVYTAVMMALIAALTMFPRVPTATGYVHLADGIIFFAALILPMPYAMLASGAGSALADLVGYPQYAIPTLVIKAVMALIVAILTKGKKRSPLQMGLIFLTASMFMQVAYFAVDLFFNGFVWAGALASVPLGLLQTVFSIPIGLILSRFRERFLVDDKKLG